MKWYVLVMFLYIFEYQSSISVEATRNLKSQSGPTNPLIQLVAKVATKTINKFIDNYKTKCFRVPDGCPNGNISYYLYTRSIQILPQKLDPFDVDTILKAKFRENAPLKVLIHDYKGNQYTAPNPQLRQAYFKRGNYNILIIDWGLLGRSPCIFQAMYNVKVVGRCAGEMLELIYASHSHVTKKKTHVIGYGLGAHVAGVLSSSLRSSRLNRLTGLDAAIPLFFKIFTKSPEMIDHSPVKYVDAYHSNAGRIGRKSPYGTVDVYLNNGRDQPGCKCKNRCSHLRAVEYFAESINNANSNFKLYGLNCSSWSMLKNGECNATNLRKQLAVMGEHISFKTYGVYYSFTNPQAPYAIQPKRYKSIAKETKRVDIRC